MQKKKKKKVMKYVRFPKGAYAPHIKLICNTCGEGFDINVNLNWEDIYTEEVIKNWNCWKCRIKNMWETLVKNPS